MSSVAIAPVATAGRESLQSLAPLFAWPDQAFSAHLDHASRTLARNDRAAARLLDAFITAIRDLGLPAVEITYTSTFDLAPSCSPYLGVHLFGDENRDRARLMIGLRSTYAAGGQDLSGELPDHIALVLSYSTGFKEDEWPDLLRLILEPALGKMEEALSATTNPYRHLISAARRVSRAAMQEGANA